MNEQPRNIPQNELFTRVLTPHLTRRRFLAAGSSALLLTAMNTAEAAAIPLLRPKQPDSQAPNDYSARLRFLGDINVQHQLDTKTGGFDWNIDQLTLHQAITHLRPYARRDELALGLAEYVDLENNLLLSFALSVNDRGITRLYFPIALPDSSLYGHTKPMNAEEAKQLHRIEASWENANPSKVVMYDAQGNPVPYNGTNQTA